MPNTTLEQTTLAATASRRVAGGLPDHTLVRQCLRAQRQAWPQLVCRYQRLIYSIPRKAGATSDEANRIFGAVCRALSTELPRLTQSGALRRWLVDETMRRTAAWQVSTKRQPAHGPAAAELRAEVLREQAMRDAISTLPAPYRNVVESLFFGPSALPSSEQARRLGSGADGQRILAAALGALESALRREGL